MAKDQNEPMDYKIPYDKDCTFSLPSEDEIREAADVWTFATPSNKWSNNDDTAGDNFGSFLAGALWMIERFKKSSNLK